MSALLLSLATFFSTLGGGLFAFKFRSKLHFILSFSAGVILGVVFFDLLPEIFRMTETDGMSVIGPMIALVAGFLFFHGVEKFLLVHHGHETNYGTHHHPEVGVFSALALVGHSFMDGVGIGLGFQVSPAVGIAVAIAVIAHDFCDGINTVSLMLLNNNTTFRSIAMLLLDSVAPVIGAVAAFAFHFPPMVLTLYLGFFAGFLLYIATADILPEAHSKARPATAVILMSLTCLGAAFDFVVSRVAG